MALNIRNPEADRLDEIALRRAARPRKDNRTPEEILGYDDLGLTSFLQ
ncbi:hypothetical protein VB734_05355 [Synechococcus sp. BA-124 BA4]|nr:hypothetical protein [Synechococcus sp. BA-124 BA4]MEA5399465.1 hypothetical protein [Synechococcus sp. BA-124 BA4]MEA5410614.1 hypothetical protein [Synechococcus sp. BA-120 BA3]